MTRKELRKRVKLAAIETCIEAGPIPTMDELPMFLVEWIVCMKKFDPSLATISAREIVDIIRDG